MNTKTKSRIIRIFFFALLLGLLAVELTYSMMHYNEDLYFLMSRFLGGFACVIFMVDFSITKILNPLGNKKLFSLLLIVPGFIIAINNFPFIAFASGDVVMNLTPASVLVLALVCLGTGFFEEMAFRGCVFTLLLKSRTQSRARIFLAILLSSAVFGAVHLVNILFGASPLGVLLQIGYSALIGALCSMVLLLTGNIWLCVILHSVYNFCGKLAVCWTLPQMIFTAIVAVIVAGYFVALFFKMPLSAGTDLFCANNAKKEETE